MGMQPPEYVLWKIRYSRFGMWYLMHHDDEYIGRCFKHTDGYWVVKPEGHARCTRGIASRRLCAEFVLDWLNGPSEGNPTEESHMEYSVDGVVWYRDKDRINYNYMRWVTIGLTVEREHM